MVDCSESGRTFVWGRMGIFYAERWTVVDRIHPDNVTVNGDPSSNARKKVGVQAGRATMDSEVRNVPGIYTIHELMPT